MAYNKKKVLLMILDGYGVSKVKEGNAVLNAKTPNLNKLQSKTYPNVLVEASGEAVGLPKGQIGNSEVGHLNIGAGRIIYTGLSLINKAIADGSFKKNVALNQAVAHAKKNKTKFHVMGLVSHGGVHSLLDHIIATLKLASEAGVKTVLHIFGDGRDVPPETLLTDVKKLMPTLKKLNVTVGVIAGRYYAMDRDKRWDRIDLAYETLLNGTGPKFKDPVEYIKQSYANKEADEFLKPAINGNVPLKDVTIQDKDAVVFANFRPDRARQLSHYIFGSKYYDSNPKLRRKNLFFVTMMQYEGIEPSNVAFPPEMFKNTLGEVVANLGLSQLRIAETEKYAHVTFFFDGGKEVEYKKEKKILVPSNRSVATYDLAPEMSCKGITDELLPTLGKFDITILNFANPDMVGHTGKYEPAVKALEALDVQVGRIIEACEKNKVTLFFTADHGNAEVMKDKDGKPVTKHSVNPVPFSCTDKTVKIATGGKLGNVATTILDYMGIVTPKEMDEKSLLLKK
ncbi:2,3-bisphosphoglycerate-independent phosphoglycerate mutase [[Mycoplasma] testudinis]|uniref:2,3-bisphosphoglycerate-independent phosphoglycerate mutase n=1 Tax=[Mycoplasma] testudinis TaxID=33924 RepID=UPI00048A1AEE|nr:2,3-bisphosphoglycerate-independent phosphoglycerate mutase [[Mycoplasma] testudinis]